MSLTPTRVEILRFLAELRFLALPQIARLCCPSSRQDLSEKSARRHMRALFDAGLVDVLPVSRAALAPPGAPNDASLLYGSAPNLYVLTAHGLEVLHKAALIERGLLKRANPRYGPKNSLFLAHELQVRGVRVWLETVAKASSGGQHVVRWQDGKDAEIKIQRNDVGASYIVRPDAWFVYRVDERENREIVLVGLVEVDQGTERGDKRWREKLEAYGALFTSNSLKATIGYVNARVLVLTPNTSRRDHLAKLIGGCGGTMASRFWLADCTVFDQTNFYCEIWRRPDCGSLKSLMSRSLKA